MTRKLGKERSGFTVIELVAVLAVIAMLVTLVLDNFRGIQGRARDAERRADITAIHIQLEYYYADNGFYPAVLSKTELIAAMPDLDESALVDPSGNDINTGSSNGYTYSPAGGGSIYTLSTVLESDGTTLSHSNL